MNETTNGNTERLADMPDDQFHKQALSIVAVWADKLREHAQTKRTLDSVRDDLNAATATITEQRETIRRLELQLLESNRTKDRALEQVGIMKGIMHSHGASIADVVGKIDIAPPAPQPPARVESAERAGLGSVERALASGG